jgi:hypothetical protein
VGLIETLEEVIAAAKGDRAVYSKLFAESDVMAGRALPLPKNEDEVDAFVKDRIRLHHESWIIGPLQDALRMLKGKA